MPMGKKIARRIDENVNINFEDAYRKKTGNDATMETLKLLARQDDDPADPNPYYRVGDRSLSSCSAGQLTAP